MLSSLIPVFCFLHKALSEIRIAIKLVQSKELDQEHPLDRSYRRLGCELQPLERASPDFLVSMGISGKRRREWEDPAPHLHTLVSTFPCCPPDLGALPVVYPCPHPPGLHHDSSGGLCVEQGELCFRVRLPL